MAAHSPEHPSRRASSSTSAPHPPRRASSSVSAGTSSSAAQAQAVDAFLAAHGYSYRHANSATLDCPICRSPFVNPAVTPCDHVFCSPCITQALATVHSCPTCRSPVAGPAALAPAPRILHQMADELEVACAHSESGCPFVGPRYTLRAHLITTCAYAETSCPCSRQGCASVMRKADLPAHLAACPFSLVPCPMSCGVHVRRAELDLHLERDCARSVVDCPHCAAQGLTRDMLEEHVGEICLEAPVECPHARFGCRWRGIRRTLVDEHIDPDVNACPYEAIKGFLHACDARMAASDAENAALRRRVVELEQRQTATALEVLACRNSLGAFALPVTRLAPSEAEESEALPSPAVPLVGSSQAEMPAFSRPALVPPIEDPWANVRMGWPQRPQPDPEPQTFDSLPSTITRLAASMHALEGSIERLEVRQEVGVLDETVRLQEEVQNLRAAVHGLRLQGAWLMMEREREQSAGGSTAPDMTDPAAGHLSDAMAAAAARRRAFALGFGNAVPTVPSYFDQMRGPPGHPRRMGLERQDTKL